MAATIAAIARERKQQLRHLMIASRKLDAAQESLEREVKRLVNRKKAVPEIADAERLSGLAIQVSSSLDNMAGVIKTMAQSWGAKY